MEKLGLIQSLSQGMLRRLTSMIPIGKLIKKAVWRDTKHLDDAPDDKKVLDAKKVDAYADVLGRMGFNTTMREPGTKIYCHPDHSWAKVILTTKAADPQATIFIDGKPQGFHFDPIGLESHLRSLLNSGRVDKTIEIPLTGGISVSPMSGGISNRSV